MWDPYAEFEYAVLPNGLTVYVAYWPDRPWVATSTLIHSGARLDPIGLEGTAHFVEHLVSRNAIIPYDEIKRFFEEVGGGVELGNTGYHNTYYQFFSPIASLEKALSILGSMLMESRLENFVEVQRQVILQEYQKSFRTPLQVEERSTTLRSLYGSDHWLSRFLSVLGQPESIGRISIHDLQVYYDEFYTPANMSFIFVGGLRLQEVLSLLKASPFGSEKLGSRVRRLEPLENFAPPTISRLVYKFSDYADFGKPMENGEYMSRAVVPGTEDKYTMSVVGDMLYQILFKELREKRGWTYSVNTHSICMQDLWEFSISANAIALESLDSIDKVIDECISSLSEHEDLMTRVIGRNVNKYSMLDVTAKQVCSNARSDLTGQAGRVLSLVEEKEAYQSVSMIGVRQVLEALRSDRRLVKLIVP